MDLENMRLWKGVKASPTLRMKMDLQLGETYQELAICVVFLSKDGSWKLIKKLKTRSISELDKETEKLKIDDGFGNITKRWESLGWVKQKEVAEKLFR